MITCDIHTRARTKRLLKNARARIVLGLDDILTQSVNGSGCNEKYGLLGSNKATEDKVKLFPRDCQDLVEEIQKRVMDATGKCVEVMVYGDGAFKDPAGGQRAYDQKPGKHPTHRHISLRLLYIGDKVSE